MQRVISPPLSRRGTNKKNLCIQNFEDPMEGISTKDRIKPTMMEENIWPNLNLVRGSLVQPKPQSSTHMYSAGYNIQGRVKLQTRIRTQCRESLHPRQCDCGPMLEHAIGQLAAQLECCLVKIPFCKSLLQGENVGQRRVSGRGIYFTSLSLHVCCASQVVCVTLDKQDILQLSL